MWVCLVGRLADGVPAIFAARLDYLLKIMTRLQEILDYLPTASTEELQKILNAVNNELPKREGNADKYVEYIEEFCEDAELLEQAWAECESLDLTCKRNKTASIWLSLTKTPYIFTDTDPVHAAHDITPYPAINKLRSMVSASPQHSVPRADKIQVGYISNPFKVVLIT